MDIGLRELLTSRRATTLMEAHDGLSARLAEKAGFKAVWIDGGFISISLKLSSRDANWTSLHQILETIERSTSLPLLFDCNSSFFGFDLLPRLAHELEQRDVAGICVGDGVPLSCCNSVVETERRAFPADVCATLRAVREALRSPRFVVMARTQALTSGLGLEETFERASAYVASGADAIFCDATRETVPDIVNLAQRWPLDVPIVTRPARYPSEPINKYADQGLNNFVFDNRCLLASIASMVGVIDRLREMGDLHSVDQEIVALEEVFSLRRS